MGCNVVALGSYKIQDMINYTHTNVMGCNISIQILSYSHYPHYVTTGITLKWKYVLWMIVALLVWIGI